MNAMNATNHKRTLEAVFGALAEGDGRPFVDAMSEDFTWTISGQGPWSGTWRGKDAVRGELFRPLFAQFAGTYRNRAASFVAEGDTVVVQCKGDVLTRAGDRYDNDYCYVCRFGADGRLVSLVEYMDTALAERVLAPPGPVRVGAT
jgi:ketosteroid isomerase-like protein